MSQQDESGWKRSTPSRLMSQARDLYLTAWDSCSPGRFARLYRQVRPYTVCGNARLRGLYDAVHRVVVEGIPGDVVECGAGRGGSAALMGLVLNQLGADRKLWVLDTFEGLPPPTTADPDWRLAARYTGGCRGELSDVSAFFGRLGILPRSNLVKGLLQETLPACPVRAIAVLHLDCDWYESVKVCLEYLYNRVSPGGVIQIDDYGHWEGARKAVEEFFRERALRVRLRWLDYTGRQFIKPDGSS